MEITGTETKEIQTTAWGFNVGSNVDYFFTRVVGVGGVFRYSHGSTTVIDEDVLANDPLKVTLGGFQAAFGLRLRFGQKM